jgi:2-hydroxychromene-2-carboxylate isomerase
MKRTTLATVYFSFRSPYSWLAVRRLLERGASAPPGADVRFVPFWEPSHAWTARLRALGKELAYVPMSKAKHLYILTDVKRLATRSGLKLAWPVDREPDWSVPHLAYLAAARLGRAVELLRRVYEMRWEEGRDVWDWSALAEMAPGLGLVPRQLLELAHSAEVQQEGLEALCSAVEDGAFGVPFFLCGREKFWGLDRLDDFLDRLERRERHLAGSGLAAPAGLALSGLVGDHAGGCG